MGVTVLPTPMRAPKANAICERWGGTLRRECLDFVIPLNERHLKMIVKEWGGGAHRFQFGLPVTFLCRNPSGYLSVQEYRTRGSRRGA